MLDTPKSTVRKYQSQSQSQRSAVFWRNPPSFGGVNIEAKWKSLMGITNHEHRESSYLRAYKPPLHLSRTLYKSAHFIQNKPNFRKARMNASSLLTKDYENEPCLQTPGKQTQSNPMSKQLQGPELSGMLIHWPDEAKTVAEGFSGFFWETSVYGIDQRL